MNHFSVWAPGARRVDLVLQDRECPMHPAAGGWWELEVTDAGPGTRYRFACDAGPPRPDPRSRSQPEGVDGPSEVWDPGSFRWPDRDWRGIGLPGAVLYELHVGTFTPEGTFAAAIGRLDHLVELGVNVVELMPVCEFSGNRGWGYDGVNLFAPHHAYGGPEGLVRLVDACHARGLGIILDVVYNHLGPAGNYLPEFGPYFSSRHSTNWGDAVNFDGPGSSGVREYVVDNALMWLRDYRIDGLRLDAVHAIVDTSERHVLAELAARVRDLEAALDRDLILIAESDLNDPRFVQSEGSGGYGLDAAWADEWHHALHAVLTGERVGYYEEFGTLAQLAKALKQAWVYDGIWSPHRGRVHGRSPGDLEGNRFVVCSQNHDQVGNRALGERSSALMSPGRLKIAAALLLTSPFVPLLFQGEEWGASSPFQYFTDHPDPDLGLAVSRGRRREFAAFGWDPEQIPDPQDPATFERSKLRWEEPGAESHREILRWYRRLLALRRQRPGLLDHRREPVDVGYDEQEGWLVFARPGLAVVVNLGPAPISLERDGCRELLLGSAPSVRLVGRSVEVPEDAVALVATG